MTDMSVRPTVARSVPPATTKAKRKRARRGRPRSLTPWLFLAVPLILLIVFTYIPVINQFWYSLTSWDGVSPDKSFVGVDNYVELFTRPALFRVFLVSLYYIGASFIQMTLALYFATLLSFNIRFKSLFKGILFFPYLINSVAVGFIFLYFFQPGGTLDSVLKLFGYGGGTFWLGDPDIANYALAGVSVWQNIGLNFVLFLGAIASIPATLYEAAEIDGASRWQQFRYIIAPGIKPILSLSFILAISGSLAVFQVPFIMTGGANGTKTFVIQTVDLAFKFNKVGLASACAVALLLIVLVVTWIQRRVVPDERVDLV